MKRKALDVAAFGDAAVLQPDPVRLATGRKQAPVITGATSRAGKVQIQGYFSEELRRRLKMLAAQSGRTIEDLLGEAIGDLLTKHRAI